MKKLLLIVVSSLLFFTCYSCYKTESITQDEQVEQEVNVKEITSFRSGMTKEDFNNLPDQDRKQFWIDRMQVLLQEPAINNAQGTLLTNTISELQQMNDFKLTPNLANLGNQLRDAFSETDFLAIFVSIDNYTFTGTNTPICGYCHVVGGPVSLPTAGLPMCNCRWTCGEFPASENSCVNSSGMQDCCNEQLGCGFFGIQSCNGHDTLF